ncbi:hypothetical protein BZG01_02975 [Labilibaculum manganireducens]|uniref:Uncharacterized protein n=1 Tax=Labilibaculum manganireducens TaxID=1940525 RepID=A0A2N3IEH2_9BACT|nr:hypothetical protein [Labilibaculum manganireducens]PKQ68699.1 hypothetical protein BZG01_02975 [Labilibaculum manganireducens]
MNTNSLALILFFLLTGCAHQGIYNIKQLNVRPISRESEGTILQSDSHELQMTPDGMFQRQMVFDVQFKNTSADSLIIDPSQFRYCPAFPKNYTPEDQKYVQCVNPDATLEQMRENKTNLIAAKNPYSLKDKSIGDILTDGLIEGSINLIFGIDTDDENYETPEEKELNWNKEKESELKSIAANMDFLENKALLKTTLPPNKTIAGKILFPIETKAIQIQVILPVGNQSDTVSFKQAIDWY